MKDRRVQNSPSYPPPLALTFEAAIALCNRVSAAANSTASPTGLLSLLETCVSQGWSPYLHDFAYQSGQAPLIPPASKLFSTKDHHAPAFSKVLELFPAAVASYPLLGVPVPPPPNPSEISRLWDSASTSWIGLGALQREHLVLFDGGAALLPPASTELRSIWLRSAAMALMPPLAPLCSSADNLKVRRSPPFYGIFSSPAWGLLNQAQPDAAHDLALYLYLHSAIKLAENGKCPDSWAVAASLAARSRPGPFSKHAGLRLQGLLHATVLKLIELDAATLLLPLVEMIGMVPLDNEVKAFHGASLNEGRGLRDRINASSRGARGLFGKLSGSIKAANLMAKDFGLGDAHPGSALTLPVFTLSAVRGATRCWQLLTSRWLPPVALAESADHVVKLASPFEIQTRLARSLIDAKAHSKDPEAAMRTLSGNLMREQRQAAMLIATLPLSQSMRAELMGDCSLPANVVPLCVAPEGQRAFAAACEKAFRKMQQGQPAPLAVPLAFDWTLHLLVAGAKPSFLFGKLPSGRLAQAARVLSMAEPQGMAARFGDPCETAVFEKDELNQFIATPTTATTSRARL